MTPTLKINPAAWLSTLAILCSAAALLHAAPRKAERVLASVTGKSLTITAGSDGAYAILSAGSATPVLRSTVEAEVDKHLLRSPDYPSHTVAQSQFTDSFGSGTALTVTHTGLAGQPDLVSIFRLYKDREWGEIELRLANTTSRPVSVTEIGRAHV